MKQICEFLKEHTKEIINFWKMKKTVLTNKELKSYVIQEHCHFFKKIFEEKYTADEKYLRIKNHYTSNYRGAT